MHRWTLRRGLGKNGCHVPHPGRWRRLSEQKTPLPPHMSVGPKKNAKAQAFCCSWPPVLKKMQKTPQSSAHLTTSPVLSGWRENSQLLALSESQHATLLWFADPRPGLTTTPPIPPDHISISKPLLHSEATNTHRGEVTCPGSLSSGAEQPAFRACLLSVFQRC